MTCEDGKDMKKLIAELKKNGEEFDVWYDISNLISAQKQDLSRYKNMLQICANIIGSNEDDLSNDLIKLMEDAKKLHGTEIMLKRCQELGIEDAKKLEYYKHLLGGRALPEILKDAKKWKELQDKDMVCITAKEYNRSIVHQTKDRQTVKRLEEGAKRIEFIADCLDDFHSGNNIKEELQKILEGKE